MIQRCHTPTNTGYYKYGARGIQVCERWRNSFAAFFADMGEPPTNEHSLDRLDNNGNYEPGNCKWSTRREQCANRRNSWLITYNGETLPAAEWARRCGVGPMTIQYRIKKAGWPLDRALAPKRP